MDGEQNRNDGQLKLVMGGGDDRMGNGHGSGMQGSKMDGEETEIVNTKTADNTCRDLADIIDKGGQDGG